MLLEPCRQSGLGARTVGFDRGSSAVAQRRRRWWGQVTLSTGVLQEHVKYRVWRRGTIFDALGCQKFASLRGLEPDEAFWRGFCTALVARSRSRRSSNC